MNILTAINKKYLPYFAAMVRSFADNNPGEHTVYIATKEVTEADLEEYRGYFSGRVTFRPVAFCDDMLAGAPTEKRWPKEIYYRISPRVICPKRWIASCIWTATYRKGGYFRLLRYRFRG